MTKRYKKVNNHSTVRKVAFTLAEVLVTLAIIGVVAALTIPTLIANTNEKSLNTADSAFQRSLGEVLKIMNIQGTLAGHESTQEFVDELSRHMKIIKICPNDKLSECFVSEFKAGAKTIEVKYLKQSKNLNKENDYGTETIGVVFGNGIRALVAYNPNCNQNQFDNSNEDNSPVKLTSTGNGKNKIVTLETDSLSILYNLQERKNNNIYSTTGNIRSINILKLLECTQTMNNKCVFQLASHSAINTCTDSTYDTNGTSNQFCADNYWAGAKKDCEDLGMRLPREDELIALFQTDSWESRPTSDNWDWFFSDTEYNASEMRFVRSFDGGATYGLKNHDNFKVLCVGN